MSRSFRTFTAIKKEVESEAITSFYFQPIDNAPLWDFKPGQYLTLKIPTTENDTLRTYSLSNDPSDDNAHRITVKREMGLSGAPDGVGSCWLHDNFQIGDNIQIAPPRGKFFLNEQSNRAVLLISGGVGLTPLVSMLHRLSHTKRQVYFLHACENGQVHALRDEVDNLASNHIKPIYIYRHPSAADRIANQFDAEGVIDSALLKQKVPLDDYDVYICGPTPFMAAMYQLSLDFGIPKNQIAYEFFGKARSLEALVEAQIKTTQPGAASNAPATLAALQNLTNPDAWAEKPATKATSANESKHKSARVTFNKSNISVDWNDTNSSLLALAENAGLNPEFSCRVGVCGSCACNLLAGDVEYFEEPLEKPDAGTVLICCSKPNGPVVLEL